VTARARFAALAQAPEVEVRLGEAALCIAAEEYEGLDVAAYLDRLDALGRAARARLPSEAEVDGATAALNALLFREQGFRGNRDDYYDPRNSFLNEVLDRRLGIPITLAVVYLEVAAAAGVTACGIGLPGHFVVRVTRAGAARLLDPFDGGTALSEAGCHALVRRVYGAEAPFDPAYLAPVSTRQILARMLANLKGIYLARQDWARALSAVDRIVLLDPSALPAVRDRGLIQARLGRTSAAIRDLETYLERAAGAADASRIRDRLRALRHARAILN
jgi:regulator of sirC expression with transglutaminase-like and TPR domain